MYENSLMLVWQQQCGPLIILLAQPASAWIVTWHESNGSRHIIDGGNSNRGCTRISHARGQEFAWNRVSPLSVVSKVQAWLYGTLSSARWVTMSTRRSALSKSKSWLVGIPMDGRWRMLRGRHTGVFLCLKRLNIYSLLSMRLTSPRGRSIKGVRTRIRLVVPILKGRMSSMSCMSIRMGKISTVDLDL